tara:strand:- start:19 stop:120 length:102 start_codon:yes stop_codon:yes gene_type:complete
MCERDIFGVDPAVRKQEQKGILSVRVLVQTKKI